MPLDSKQYLDQVCNFHPVDTVHHEWWCLVVWNGVVWGLHLIHCFLGAHGPPLQTVARSGLRFFISTLLCPINHSTELRQEKATSCTYCQRCSLKSSAHTFTVVPLYCCLSPSAKGICPIARCVAFPTCHPHSTVTCQLPVCMPCFTGLCPPRC